MKASETKLFLLFQGNNHFMVPLFQRPYSWDYDDLETLWNDLLETHELGQGSTHFLGSLVTKSIGATAEGVSPFIVIDGQQRLTTLTILLAAIRDLLHAADPKEAEKIQNLYLANPYASGLHRYSLMPTQVDQPSYRAVIDGNPERIDSGRISDAYRFFRRKLLQATADDQEEPVVELKEFLQTVLQGIELVSITLEENDSEYRIFESLNAKGTPLTQADLIRNYFFMRIHPEQHMVVYNDMWLPMQQSLEDSLEDFFRYEFMSYGRFVRHGDVYNSWKLHLDSESANDLVRRLDEISAHARLFRLIIKPEEERDHGIRRRLEFLNRWGAQSAYPFILFAYREYDAQRLSAEEFERSLQLIESFLVRRLFASVPTNALNRLFLRLPDQLPGDQGFLEGVHQVLSEPGRRWPDDRHFREAIQRHPLFTDSRSEQRRVILEALERSYGHKEYVDLSGLSIEHIMPQTISAEWASDLGISEIDDADLPLHVLGNLTLTGYNPELGNNRFAKKRVRYGTSNIEMNKEIAVEEHWDIDAIHRRGNMLAKRAIKLWPGPMR